MSKITRDLVGLYYSPTNVGSNVCPQETARVLLAFYAMVVL